MTILFTLLAPLLIATIDISGVWNLEMTFTESGTRSTGVCTFKQEKQTLTGTCGTEPAIPITGEMNDQRITWRFTAEQNGQKHTMTFSGVLDEATTDIKGTCRVEPGQEGTFTAKKR